METHTDGSHGSQFLAVVGENSREKNPILLKFRASE